MPGAEASGVDGGGVGTGRSAGMTLAGLDVELAEEPPLVGAVDARSGMKPLPSVGGLGGGGGGAGGAGGGGAEGRSDEVGFGAETGGGNGVEGETGGARVAEGELGCCGSCSEDRFMKGAGADGARVIEGELGCFGGCSEDGFMRGIGGGNGVGEVFGVSDAFAGTGVVVAQGFLLVWVSRGFWEPVGCGAAKGGKLGPDDEAAIAELPDPDGVCEESLPERVGAGASGLGCGAGGLFGGSVPPAGRMKVVLLGPCLFASGDGDSGGGAEFEPVGAGFTVWFVLSPADPAAGLPHSLAPRIAGAVALGNSTAAGEGVLPEGDSSCSNSLRLMPDEGRGIPPVEELDFPGSDLFSLVSLSGFKVGAGGGRMGFVLEDVDDPEEDGGIGEGGAAGAGGGVDFVGFVSGSSSEDGSVTFWGAGGISTGSEMATLGEEGRTRSRIFSPITAPVMHRNVQVIEIPILCSSFMRLLLCFN